MSQREYLETHHIEYQCEGGGHQMTNITMLCSAHHDLLHRGLLRITGLAPNLLFERITEDGDVFHLLSTLHSPTGKMTEARASKVPRGR